MMSRSIRLNERIWRVDLLGERTLLFQTDPGGDSLSAVHELSSFLDQRASDNVEDIVPAYESLAVIFKEGLPDLTLYLSSILNAYEQKVDLRLVAPKVYTVPVCYELGLDWEEICSHTSLSKAEIIKRHHTKSYTLAMMGFIPGFVFLDGLTPELHCPRRSSPRAEVPAGSVGIGGSQTGIYSLKSPGGWQIIGQTPIHFFDAEKMPPTQLNLGDQINFIPITLKEFEEWSDDQD